MAVVQGCRQRPAPTTQSACTMRRRPHQHNSKIDRGAHSSPRSKIDFDALFSADEQDHQGAPSSARAGVDRTTAGASRLDGDGHPSRSPDQDPPATARRPPTGWIASSGPSTRTGGFGLCHVRPTTWLHRPTPHRYLPAAMAGSGWACRPVGVVSQHELCGEAVTTDHEWWAIEHDLLPRERCRRR